MFSRRSIHSARTHDRIAVAPPAIGRVGVPAHHPPVCEQSGAATSNAQKRWVGGPTLRGRSGFTLVELLVSIAIALLLILGVNEVFKIGAQTVGAGQAFSSITRDERTAQFSFYTDVHNALTVSQPALMFCSQCTFAFRDPQEAAAEPSGTPSTLTINNNPQLVSNVLLSSRNYRTDTLGFFAGGDLYQRQTASDGYFVSSTTSSNAWIWYGHLMLPNNTAAAATGVAGYTPGTTANWFYPGGLGGGISQNDNNRYAAQWILGRMAMLLVPTPNSANLADANYIVNTTPASNPTAAANPLGYSALSNNNIPIFTSRYDLVAASTSSFNAYNTPALRSMMMLTAPLITPPSASQQVLRYQANPFPVKPLNAANMAAVAPIFLNHCCHFIVEYAGDYLTQDNNPASATYGQVATGAAGAQGDNVVDFVVINGIRKIRWYGFPRDADGDGIIDPLHDVVPLRDILQAASPLGPGLSAASGFAPWESGSLLASPPQSNYAASGATQPGAQYFCSWGSESSWPVLSGAGNGLPRMLRITISLDDPAGRLAAPQTYEYVIDLGAQH
jgi:prepilin-type N-terminal cleavage/methylation domain-containing protein